MKKKVLFTFQQAGLSHTRQICLLSSKTKCGKQYFIETTIKDLNFKTETQHRGLAFGNIEANAPYNYIEGMKVFIDQVDKYNTEKVPYDKCISKGKWKGNSK